MRELRLMLVAESQGTHVFASATFCSRKLHAPGTALRWHGEVIQIGNVVQPIGETVKA